MATAMRAKSRRRRRSSGGGGDPVIVQAFAADYRLWARVPAAVTALLFLGDPNVPKPQDAMLAIVGRPVFPKGVCTGCGCQEHDACIVDEGMGPQGCRWIDETQTRCSACGPAAKS